jgi:hypothetical protein
MEAFFEGTGERKDAGGSEGAEEKLYGLEDEASLRGRFNFGPARPATCGHPAKTPDIVQKQAVTTTSPLLRPPSCPFIG